jgi:uncharacterized repeat protein (TIGR02543 family)
LLAGLALNDPNMLSIGDKSGDYAYTAPYGPDNTPPDLIRFEEDETTFYVSQMDLDMSNSTLWVPDTRADALIPYNELDLGLPEWGLVRLYDRRGINKSWGATYRTVIGQSYSGIILAIYIMGARDLWNHEAFFDYNDRYMQVEVRLRQSSRFVEDMWDTYRNDYGTAWTMYPFLNVTAVGGSVIRIPDKTAYNLAEKVKLKATSNAGYKFNGWLGDPAGQENPMEIVLYANRNITADFTAVEP